jgi:Domain of unknown function (DUF4426)
MSTGRMIAVALVTIALACGCGKTPQQAVAAAQPSDETFKDFGNYELHFNALRTDSLTPEIARANGIQRSQNRVMLSVTVLRKDAAQTPRKPVEASVQVDCYNLNGQLKNIEVRRVTEGDAIYYIGEVTIAGAEILVFDITATPTGEAAPLTAKLKREFFSN